MAQIPPGRVYGDGHDGAKTVSGNEILNVYKACTGTSGNSNITVTAGDEASFAAGDLVMLHKSRGNTTTNAGTWELLRVSSTASGQVNFATNLVNSYQDSGAEQSQSIIIPQYTTFSCPSSQTLSATSWNSTTGLGGIIAICARTSITVGGTVAVNGGSASGGTGGTTGGYNGGDTEVSQQGQQGEGTPGDGGRRSDGAANGNGGGGAYEQGASGGAGGGGGGNGTAGSDGTANASNVKGLGGSTEGSTDLTEMNFGGGGGSGAEETGDEGGGGGAGGGNVFLISKTVTFTGSITSNGGNGATHQGYGGGGGAGGSVLIKGKTVDIGTNKITCSNGAGGTNGGAGGDGRIRIDWGSSLSGSTNDPVASTNQDRNLVPTGGSSMLFF